MQQTRNPIEGRTTNHEPQTDPIGPVRSNHFVSNHHKQQKVNNQKLQFHYHSRMEARTVREHT